MGFFSKEISEDTTSKNKSVGATRDFSDDSILNQLKSISTPFKYTASHPLEVSKKVVSKDLPEFLSGIGSLAALTAIKGPGKVIRSSTRLMTKPKKELKHILKGARNLSRSALIDFASTFGYAPRNSDAELKDLYKLGMDAWYSDPEIAKTKIREKPLSSLIDMMTIVSPVAKPILKSKQLLNLKEALTPQVIKSFKETSKVKKLIRNEKNILTEKYLNELSKPSKITKIINEPEFIPVSKQPLIDIIKGFQKGKTVATPEATGKFIQKTIDTGKIKPGLKGKELLTATRSKVKEKLAKQLYDDLYKLPKDQKFRIKINDLDDVTKATISKYLDEPDTKSLLKNTYGAADDITKHFTEELPKLSASIDKIIKNEFTNMSEKHWLVKAHDKALDAWRTTVLTLRPKWYVNNIIGNMIFNSYGGVGPLSYGRRMFSKKWKGIIPDELLGKGIYSELSADIAGKYGRVGKLFSKLSSYNEKVDDWFRSAHYIKKGNIAARKELVKYNILDAVKTKEKLKYLNDIKSNHPDLVKEILTDVEKVNGNFKNLSPFERDKVKKFVPFYNFAKLQTLLIARMPQNPLRLKAIKELQDFAMLTLSPSEQEKFKEGKVKLYSGTKEGEKRDVYLNTEYINPINFPYRSGGEFLSALSPFVKAPLEAIQKKSLFTGKELRSPLTLRLKLPNYEEEYYTVQNDGTLKEGSELDKKRWIESNTPTFPQYYRLFKPTKKHSDIAKAYEKSKWERFGNLGITMSVNLPEFEEDMSYKNLDEFLSGKEIEMSFKNIEKTPEFDMLVEKASREGREGKFWDNFDKSIEKIAKEKEAFLKDYYDKRLKTRAGK